MDDALAPIVARQPTILIVDDLLSARRIVIRLLQRLGFTKLEEAANGADALARIELGNVELVISDWEMPNMTGLQLVQTLRERDATKILPFIMITASTGREEVLHAAQAGVSDYIAKPFDVVLLRTKIVAVLGDHERAGGTK